MAPDFYQRPGSLLVERHMPREGPPYYLLWKPDVSTFAHTEEQVLAFAKWPKSTPTGAALREWLAQYPLCASTDCPVDAGPAAITTTAMEVQG